MKMCKYTPNLSNFLITKTFVLRSVAEESSVEMEMALSKLKELRQRDRELEALEAKLDNTTTTPKPTTMDPVEAKRIQQQILYQRWLVRENKRKAMRLQAAKNLNVTMTTSKNKPTANKKSYAYNPKVAVERYLQRFKTPKPEVLVSMQNEVKNSKCIFCCVYFSSAES